MEVSPLFKLCIERKWNEVVKLVKNKPSEANTLLSTGKRGAQKVSAIQVVLSHAKCQGQVPLTVVDTLLKAAPEMANNSCNLYTGNVPLHAVFYNAFFNANTRDDIARRILAVKPLAVKTRNKDGRTPLHTNCSQHCNYEPICTLLTNSPVTASWKDFNGDLPIHLACRSQKSPNKSIIELYKYFPEGILTENISGQKPIDLIDLSPMDPKKRRARKKLLRNLEMKYIKNEKENLSFQKQSNIEINAHTGNCIDSSLLPIKPRRSKSRQSNGYVQGVSRKRPRSIMLQESVVYNEKNDKVTYTATSEDAVKNCEKEVTECAFILMNLNQSYVAEV